MQQIDKVISSFQPTYKELKPNTYDWEANLVDSFQPTYKELKLKKQGLDLDEMTKFLAYL